MRLKRAAQQLHPPRTAPRTAGHEQVPAELVSSKLRQEQGSWRKGGNPALGQPRPGSVHLPPLKALTAPGERVF